MSIMKSKLSFIVICRCILGLWLLVLSFLIFSNLGVTTQLMRVANSDQKSHQIEAIESHLVQLSEQLNTQRQASLSNPVVTQTDLTEAQQELRSRIQSLNETLDAFASKADIQTLQQQIDGISETIKKLQQTITPKPTEQVEPIRTVQPPKVVVQPFKVLGSEMRGGERFLVVQPSGHDAINSVILLSEGQRVRNWILRSIGDNSAVFQIGNRQRRITFSQ